MDTTTTTMVTTKTQSLEQSNTDPNPQINNDQTHKPKMSPYEQSREERIQANLERMQKLGLVDLSLKLRSLTTPKRTPRNNPSPAKLHSPLPPTGSLRRSSRLHNVTPVSYSEAALAKKDGLLEDEDPRLEVVSKPEVYTEEHEKLLGNTERSWTLFVDGYGKDGKRIYDPIKGKTCHQCRQKTLGYRTHCCKCQIVQGQFCGDCLYMRYGEHVLEAIENPNWICPVCRGICNCSLCRQAKGWSPTGPLYKKISRLGYKSVAHYLVETRRSQNTVVKDLVTVKEVSAKRSLPFSEMENPSKRSQISNEQIVPLMSQSEDKIHDELKPKNEEQLPNNRNLATNGQAKSPLPFLGSGLGSENLGSVEVNHEVNHHLGLSEPMFEDKGKSGLKSENEKQLPHSGNLASDGQTKLSFPFLGAEAQSENRECAQVKNETCGHLRLSKPIFEDKKDSELKSEEEKQLKSTGEHDNSDIIPESGLKHKKKHVSAFQPSPDSIAARLRSRHLKDNGSGSAELASVKGKITDLEQPVNSLFSDQEVEKEKETHVEDSKNADSVIELEICQKIKKKTTRATEPNPDSIGGRLRQRRRMDKSCDDKLTIANEQKNQV